MNVLFVSIAFPPKQDPECLQTAKYFKYLSRNEDLNISVVTSAIPTLNMPYDPVLEKYDEGYAQKIELSVPENKYVNFLIRKLFPDFLRTPDSKFLFHWQGRKVRKQLQQIPDIIYSRSNPVSSALLAMKLKKKLNKPWVMHLSDPWADSPLHNYSGKVYRKNKALERKCFATADKICFTTNKTLGFYSEIYPQYRNKFEIFQNVYDSEDARETLPICDYSKLTIVHTGGLTAKRSPVYLFPVLEYLAKRGFDTDKNLEIVFAGDADRYNRNILAEQSFSCLHYLGRVSFDKSKELQRQAHLLLCIEDPVDNEKASMFFPSKILDYMIAKRKFFAITSKGSQLSGTFQKYGWDYFTHNDVEGIGDFILKAYNELKKRNDCFFTLEKLPGEFDVQTNSQRLKKLFENVCVPTL